MEADDKVNLYPKLPVLIQIAILHSRHGGTTTSFYETNLVLMRQAVKTGLPAASDEIGKQSRLLLARMLEMAGARQDRAASGSTQTERETNAVFRAVRHQVKRRNWYLSRSFHFECRFSFHARSHTTAMVVHTDAKVYCTVSMAWSYNGHTV